MDALVWSFNGVSLPLHGSFKLLAIIAPIFYRINTANLN